ncbi:Hsp20/alpha crystallin family protein [Halorubrum rutilum]|uniref:Hsp20/alpha crystallin family protein n=1 Tax=Halorubrum rutilum TaxID=1364933 RepID=A0ABD6AGL7_9EURY|nr:Hsp20/alpha crystallin family protein [Halorubrum rutilum]
MNHQQTRSTGDGPLLRRFEYEDGWIVAADLGADAANVSVDTVGETAIVVVEGDGEPVESEFELPGPAASSAVANGVVTVEGGADGDEATEGDTAEGER